MTARVAKPPTGQRLSFTLPYPCTCGRERTVLTRGIAANLPLSPDWHAVGACPTCGRTGRWRIETRPTDYLIHIERG